jgi:hypothetical protein
VDPQERRLAPLAGVGERELGAGGDDGAARLQTPRLVRGGPIDLGEALGQATEADEVAAARDRHGVIAGVAQALGERGVGEALRVRGARTSRHGDLARMHADEERRDGEASHRTGREGGVEHDGALGPACERRGRSALVPVRGQMIGADRVERQEHHGAAADEAARGRGSEGRRARLGPHVSHARAGDDERQHAPCGEGAPGHGRAGVRVREGERAGRGGGKRDDEGRAGTAPGGGDGSTHGAHERDDGCEDRVDAERFREVGRGDERGGGGEQDGQDGGREEGARAHGQGHVARDDRADGRRNCEDREREEDRRKRAEEGGAH